VRHISSVAARELASLFVSPVAYGVLSLFSVLAAVFFILNLAWFNEQIFFFQQMQAMEQLERLNLNEHLIGEFYGSMSVVLLFLIPGVTMGLFAAEKTNGTQELLMTCPLTIWDVVIGKLAGAGTFVLLLAAIVGLYPALLFVYGDPELGPTLSGLAGVLLMGWTYVAVGAFASSLTSSQVVAFLITFVMMLVLLLLPAVSDLGLAVGAPGVGQALRALSTQPHFEQLVKGVVDTADLAYFAAAIAAFAVLTKTVVESARWR
jgi:ABC-2 type transport system permease protein